MARVGSLLGPIGGVARRIVDSLYGYDVFSSYSRVASSEYAQALWRDLQAAGLRVFLYQSAEDGFPAGAALPAETERVVRASSVLVVVVDRETLGNRHVRTEIAWFRRLGRLAIPIDRTGLLRDLRIAPAGRRDLAEELRLDEAGVHLLDFVCDELIAVEETVSADAPSSALVAKIKGSLGQVRRSTRRVRVLFVFLCALTAIAVLAAALARRERAARDEAEHLLRETQLADAFHLVDVGTARLDLGDPKAARSRFQEAVERFVDVGGDPLLGKYGLLAVDLAEITLQPVCEVGWGARSVVVSDDGEVLGVVYDLWSGNNSDPDEELLDQEPALILLRRSTCERIGQLSVGSELGGRIHDHDIDVLGVVRPAAIVVDLPGEGVAQVDLETGTRIFVDARSAETWRAKAARLPASDLLESFPPALRRAMEPAQLWSISPKDGIDHEYGRRVPESVTASSRDGRRVVVGTYEGRLLVLDKARRVVRELSPPGRPVYALAVLPSGEALVVDDKDVLRVDITTPRIWEGQLVTPGEHESVLGVGLSEDGSWVAVLTEERLVARGPGSEGIERALPRAVGHEYRYGSAHHVVVGSERVLAAAADGTFVELDLADGVLIDHSVAQGAYAVWIQSEPAAFWHASTDEEDGTVLIDARPVGRDPRVSEPWPLFDVFGLARAEASARTVSIEALGGVPPVVADSLLVNGDTWLFVGNGSDLDETLLRFDLDGNPRSPPMIISRSTQVRNGPDLDSFAETIDVVLPGSDTGRVLACGSFGTLYAGGEGRLEAKQDGVLAARDVPESDPREPFTVTVFWTNEALHLGVAHRERDAAYMTILPWPHELPPELAAISGNGLHVVVLDRRGAAIAVDVSDEVGGAWHRDR